MDWRTNCAATLIISGNQLPFASPNGFSGFRFLRKPDTGNQFSVYLFVQLRHYTLLCTPLVKNSKFHLKSKVLFLNYETCPKNYLRKKNNMKVGELREKLAKLKKDEIIKLAVEFYKAIPKSKKEDRDIDELVNNPHKKKKTRSKSQLSIELIEFEVYEFIDNARDQYYLIPNRIVPKKERATWRFKVKKWYKELINTKRTDLNLALQSRLLSDLYELICESCGYQYFTAYDSFQSIGVEQREFYKSVITLLQEAKGKRESLEKGIKLIIDNYLNRYTLYSELMEVLISTLTVPDLKYYGIEIVKKLLVEANLKSNPKKKNKGWGHSAEEYKKKRRIQNLAELGYRLSASLFEFDEAIAFYKKNYKGEDAEVRLYVLVHLLFQKGEKDRIVNEIEAAIKKRIKPREGLLKLLKEIKEKGELPKYMS